MLGADNVDQYHLYVDAITAVKQNKVQGAIMDLGPAEKFLQANPDLMIYDDELTEENYAFGIKKDNKELLDAVNEALAELSASGELKRIFDKYVNDEPGAGDDIDLNKGEMCIRDRSKLVSLGLVDVESSDAPLGKRLDTALLKLSLIHI